MKLLALLCYLSVSFFYLQKYPLLTSDEVIYCEPAANFLSEGRFSSKLYPDMRGGYGRSSVIQHGRIPLFARVVLFKLFGVSLLTMRLPSFLAGAGILFLVFLISKRLFQDESAAFLISGLCALSHPFVFSSHSARPDIFIALFAAGSVFCLLEAVRKDSKPLYFLSGLIAALSVDVHIPGAMVCFLLLGAMIAIVPFMPFPWKTYFAAGAGVALGCAWWVSVHVLIDRELFFSQLSSSYFISPMGGKLDGLKMEWHRWFDFFWRGAFHRNMFLLVLFGVSGAHAFFYRSLFKYRALLGILGGGIAGFFLASPSKNPQYMVFIFSFFMMLLGGFLCDLWNSEVPRKKAWAAAISLCFGVFLLLENAEKLRFYRCDYSRFMEKVKAHVPKDSVVCASASYWPGLRGYALLVPHELLFYKMILDAKGSAIKYFEGTNEDFYKRQGVQYMVADAEVLEGNIYQKQYLLPFIESRGELAGEFQDDFYNFSLYMTRRSPGPLATKIYKIKPF